MKKSLNESFASIIITQLTNIVNNEHSEIHLPSFIHSMKIISHNLSSSNCGEHMWNTTYGKDE